MARNNIAPTKPSLPSKHQTPRHVSNTPRSKPPVPQRTPNINGLNKRVNGPTIPSVRFKAHANVHSSAYSKNKLQLSLSASYIDLVKRRGDALRINSSEKQYLAFLHKLQNERYRWVQYRQDCNNLKEKLSLTNNELLAKEYKIKQARKLVEDETKARVAAEQEREELAEQLNMVREILLSSTDKPIDQATLERVKHIDVSKCYNHNHNPGDVAKHNTPNLLQTSVESILDVSDLSFDDTIDMINNTRDRSSHDLSNVHESSRYKRKSSGKFEMAEKRRQSRQIRSQNRSLHAQQHDTSVSEPLNNNNNNIVIETKLSVLGGVSKTNGVGDIIAKSVAPTSMKQLKQAARKSRERRSGKFLDGDEFRQKENKLLSNEDQEQEVYNDASAPPDVNVPHVVKPKHPSLFSSTASKLNSYIHGLSPNNNHIQKSSLPNKAHYFVEKKLLSSVYCCLCNCRISFQRLHVKCRECQISAHIECRSKVNIPCVSSSQIRTPTKKNAPSTALFHGVYNNTSLLSLSDLIPFNPPYIPPIIVFCIREVEHRGLDQVGIYRVPGNESDTVDLLDKFMKFMCGKSTNVPSLSKYDIHVITSTVRRFLRNLKEPLIPTQLRQRFIDVTTPRNKDSQIDWDEVYKCVSILPLANQHTLALLMMHLSIVSDSVECKMPLGNLAMVMGPTLVGYSSNQPLAIMSEAPYQQNVVMALLQLPTTYWSSLLNNNIDYVSGSGNINEEVNNIQSPTNKPPPQSCVAKRTRSRLISNSELDVFKSPMLA